jgi:hypothetical protein
METFTQLFGDLLAFVYHCFDRIVIYGLRVPVERDHGFRWKMITQSGGT